MRAGDLDEAIALVDAIPFGLTSGIQSLDDREIARWLERVEAGNLYVNRHITGAVVARQSFGGWKASSVGPGAKAGGPNYVAQLGHWRQVTVPTAAAPLPPAMADLLQRCFEAVPPGESAAVLRASASSYAHAWQEHFGHEHEPVRLLGERNVFRYRPCRRMLVRAEAATPAGRLALAQVLLAARACGVPVAISLAEGVPGPWLADPADIEVAVEPERALVARVGTGGVERLRALVPLSREARAATHAAGVVVLDAPVLAAGRLELRAYVREQAVSRTVHRYGTVMEEPGG